MTFDTSTIITREGVKPYRRLDRFVGKCWRCGAGVQRDRSVLKAKIGGFDTATVHCNACRALTKVTAVRWTQSAKPHECDDRCLAARGPNCSCKCGGENHGRNAGV